MFLHILRHVEAQQFHAQRIRQLLGHLGFTHAGRTREEVVPDGLIGLTQPGPRQFDRRAKRHDGIVLTKDHPLERVFQIFQHHHIVFRHVLRRDPRDLGHDGLDLFGADGLAPLGSGHEMLCRTGLVDNVDSRVRQFAVVDVAMRQFHGSLDRVRGVFDAVVLLEIGLEAPEDLGGIFNRRLVHVDLLEPAAQRAVLFEVLAELLIGGGAHGAKFAALKRGLQKVRCIHGPAGSGTSANNGVDFVDEQHRVLVLFKLCHDSFQPLLKVTTVAGASKQRAHVERIDRGIGQNLRGFARNDLARQAFSDSRLAHARITHQKRVVLAAAAEHLNAALDFAFAPDEGVDVAFAGLGVEVHAVFRQRGFFLVAFGYTLGFFLVLGSTSHRAGLAVSGVFGDAMGDEVHRVIACHVLLLQEIGRVAFAFGKDRDKHIGACHLCPTRRLHMDRGTLNDALEGGCGHGFRAVDVRDQIAQVIINELDQRIAQIRDVDRTGFHHLNRVRLIKQRQQQVFQRGEFVAAGIGQRKGCVDCLLKCSRE